MSIKIEDIYLNGLKKIINDAYQLRYHYVDDPSIGPDGDLAMVPNEEFRSLVTQALMLTRTYKFVGFDDDRTIFLKLWKLRELDISQNERGILEDLIQFLKAIVSQIESGTLYFKTETSLLSAKNIIFISYDTQEIELANFIESMITSRLGSRVTCFIAKNDIGPGADPYRTMLDEHLLRAIALVALCSTKSKTSPWLWWESSAVWARNGFVIPLFVDLPGKDFGGPITIVAQGRSFFKHQELFEALQTLSSKLFPDESFAPMTEDELAKLAELQKKPYTPLHK